MGSAPQYETGWIARWDLDKTYLRTEFATLRDLVRTALERPADKQAFAGATATMRELIAQGVAIHILSGSPEQMRRRLAAKLLLDGVKWQSLTLKPNLENILRLRFRAIKDQLGYKLPALLSARASLRGNASELPRELLFGDDSEADAFVYALYADIGAGLLHRGVVREVLERGRVYDDRIEATLSSCDAIDPVPFVARMFIHLERQSPPEDFAVYGRRLVPIYNYFQVALCLCEDERIPAEGVLRVAREFVVDHHFDGEALTRSYRDLARRGFLRGTRTEELRDAFTLAREERTLSLPSQVGRFIETLDDCAAYAKATFCEEGFVLPNYLELVAHHNARRRL